MRENPPLRQIKPDRLRVVVVRALEEVESLELLARTHERALRERKLPWPIETVKRIKTLWVLSGSGYYREPFKIDPPDAYSTKPWSSFQGRHRLTCAALLMRRFAESIADREGEIPHSKIGQNGSKEQTRDLVARYGPTLIFNGREDENADVRQILSEGGIIPPEKVHIYVPTTSRNAPNTIDQVRAFQIPPDLKLATGDEIGIISHAPHLMRASHSLSLYSTVIPDGVSMRALPLPSQPDSGEYIDQEIRGLLYYTFITGEAAEKPYSFAT